MDQRLTLYIYMTYREMLIAVVDATQSVATPPCMNYFVCRRRFFRQWIDMRLPVMWTRSVAPRPRPMTQTTRRGNTILLKQSTALHNGNDKREPMYIEKRLTFKFNTILFTKYTLIKENLFDSQCMQVTVHHSVDQSSKVHTVRTWRPRTRITGCYQASKHSKLIRVRAAWNSLDPTTA